MEKIIMYATQLLILPRRKLGEEDRPMLVDVEGGGGRFFPGPEQVAVYLEPIKRTLYATNLGGRGESFPEEFHVDFCHRIFRTV